MSDNKQENWYALADMFLRLIFFLYSVTILSAHLSAEFVFEKPPFQSCHASTLTETSSGKLLCAYFAGSAEGAKDVGIWLSEKGKEGWSAPRLVAQNSNVACWNPVLFTLPSGDILLFYKEGTHPTNWSGVMLKSSDEGNHWSKGQELPAGIIGPVKNRPLQLEDGTLLCGSSIESWHRWGCWLDITPDEGETWTKSGPISLKTNLFGIIQPAIFFISDGGLRLLARSHQTSYICTTTSSDCGKSWTEVVPTSLPNPNSAIDAIRLHNGDILLVYNNSSENRWPLNVALSKDDGVHWSNFLTLEEQPGEYSYPTVIQTNDHLVHISYTYNREKIKHVTLSHFVRYSHLNCH